MKNLALSNYKKVNLKECINNKREGIPDDKYIKRYFGLECGVLLRTNNLSHEEWLEARKLGYDYIGTEHLLIEDNEAMYWGRVMEDVIAKEFQLRNNVKINRVNAILKHKENTWALGNIDRLITNESGEKGILEIKTVSEYIKAMWEGDEVPPQYMVQIQWYMYVTGATFGYFAALIGGNKYVQKYVERDEELINMLVDIAKDFWENNVIKKIPPLVDGSEASSNLLNSLYPSSNENTASVLPEEALGLITLRDELKTNLDAINNKIKDCENKLKDMLKENEVGIVGDRKVIWKTFNRSSIDSNRLKEEKPELFKKYLKTSSYRKFDIK